MESVTSSSSASGPGDGGGTATFNAFVSPTGGGLFAYEPFPKGSPTSSNSSSTAAASPPPGTPLGQDVGAMPAGAGGLGVDRAGSPTASAAAAQVSRPSSSSSSQQETQDQDDGAVAHSEGNPVVGVKGSSSSKVVLAAGELQSQDQIPSTATEQGTLFETLLKDGGYKPAAAAAAAGPGAAMGFDSALAATTLSMGNLDLRPEQLNMANAQAYLAAQQHQQQHQHQQHQDTTGLLFQAQAGGGVGLLAQQNPLLAQQAALAAQSNVYSKYGLTPATTTTTTTTTGGYPAPLKTPGAPIKTTDSDKGPEGCNLFVFHIPNDMTNLDLYQMFSAFGQVISARIMVDKVTGRSRGFGFVSYNSPDSAQQAIQRCNGLVVGHKRLKVEQKKEKGGGGGGSGGAGSTGNLMGGAAGMMSGTQQQGMAPPLHTLQRWQAHLASQAVLQQQVHAQMQAQAAAAAGGQQPQQQQHYLTPSAQQQLMMQQQAGGMNGFGIMGGGGGGVSATSGNVMGNPLAAAGANGAAQYLMQGLYHQG